MCGLNVDTPYYKGVHVTLTVWVGLIKVQRLVVTAVYQQTETL